MLIFMPSSACSSDIRERDIFNHRGADEKHHTQELIAKMKVLKRAQLNAHFASPEAPRPMSLQMALTCHDWPIGASFRPLS